MGIQHNWHLRELEANEEEQLHIAMDDEFSFYEAVQNGEVEYVMKNIEKGSFASEAGKGKLSSDPLQNIKYHFIVTTALLTRYCLFAGMSMEQAYRLSDYYIVMMDSVKSIEAVSRIHGEMVLDFTRRMREFQNSKVTSRPIYNALEYIYTNIHNRITIEEIAQHIDLSTSHLSRTFKKEMGISISAYIRGKKIEHAKNLLRYSEYSYVEIANYLAFDSQSHFIKVFKDHEGITPHQYRSEYHKSSW